MCNLPPFSQTQETNVLITTILDVQPRLAGTGGGKTNDEIVAELAENILGKLPEKLDPDNGLAELFEPNEKGIINSLSTVLLQEIDRFNKLLKVIKVRDCVYTLHTNVHTYLQYMLVYVHTVWPICTVMCTASGNPYTQHVHACMAEGFLLPTLTCTTAQHA